MDSSDDESDSPKSINQYWFANEADEPVSFGVLPVKWTDNDNVDVTDHEIFVRGNADNGAMKLYKRVIAWKIDLDNSKPDIKVFTKEKTWIKLEKPRKSFEDIIRSILITVHCFAVLKRNPDTTEKSLWDHLSKKFCSYELKPSQNDLLDQRPLIAEALKQDKTLAKSKFLTTFLEEKSRKRKLHEDVVPAFFVDDVEDDGEEVHDDENDSDDELFDSVCAFCDNGGDLICCEGSCLRSFHGTVEAGEESTCESLGYTEDEFKVVEANDFFCKNCQHKQHQCFACGKLGSSDKESSKAEVLRCSSATCGHFYHPRCIAKLICRENVSEAKNLQERITEGEPFTCPYHKCRVCKGIENKKIKELQFAVCRRCPTSFHRKCLPREISFDGIEEEGIVTRAWEGLLPNRILLYCLKHEIDDELGTPVRDHIIFPQEEGKKINKHKLVVKTPTSEGVLKKKKEFASASQESTELRAPKVISKNKELSSGSSLPSKTSTKELKRPSSFTKGSGTTKKLEKVLSRSNSNPSKNVKVLDASQKFWKKSGKSASAMVDRSSSTTEPGESLGARLFPYLNKDSEEFKVAKQDTTTDYEFKKSAASKSNTKKSISGTPALDADSVRRLNALMRETESQITLESVLKKYKVPSTHAYSSKTAVDRNITLGKVEASVEAVRTAYKKLEGGGSVDDAAAVCEPQILHQIFKWRSKLRVYLAPFLHGMRYSSFGRHFTKVDKLEEIVDRFHWYVQNGDMIVDFCCGANDFSCLMKKKLDETGKNCSYKNYDILQAKNDFNFEQRDWMTVRKNELPSGSELIMGLNPPFGVKAALANKFIDKALEFNPKLLILIVPPETERLDQKKTPYDLVWEDDNILSGKSFYLPGSVNVKDKQMDQWNVKPPVLYLWSRRDWASKHKSIAEKHGHLSNAGESYHSRNVHLSSAEDSHYAQNDHGYDASVNHDLPMQMEENHNSEKIVSDSSDNNKYSHNFSNRQSQDDLPQSTENNLKERVMPLEDKRPSKMPRSVNETYSNWTARHSPSNVTESRFSFVGPYSNSAENSSPMKDGPRSNSRNSHMHFGAASNDLSQMYNVPSTEHYFSGPYRSGLDEPSLNGQGRDATENFGYNNGLFNTGMEEAPFTRDSVDSFVHSGPYKTSLEESRFDGFGYNSRPYAREDELRSQIHMYGQNPEPRYDPIVGSLPPMSCGFAGSTPEPTYNSTSVTNRYAPRLDDPNPAMIGSFCTEPLRPVMMNRGGFYDPRAPPPPPPPPPQPHYHYPPHQPGYNGVEYMGQPGYNGGEFMGQPGYNGGESIGFAPGPRQSYPSNNSAEVSLVFGQAILRIEQNLSQPPMNLYKRMHFKEILGVTGHQRWGLFVNKHLSRPAVVSGGNGVLEVRLGEGLVVVVVSIQQ
ncbi:hypothetical protein ACFE04_007016 [Oxalis oulophora]